MGRVLAVFFLLPFTSLWAQQMTLDEVQTVVAQAVQESLAASPDTDRVIAVVDREGHALAVWRVDVGPLAVPNEAVLAAVAGDAVRRAGTAAFLSSNQNAFTTRTAAFITEQNFPPGVANRPNGPLVGVGLSNLAFTDTNTFKAPMPDGTFPVPPVPGIDALQDGLSARPAKELRSVPYVRLSADAGGVPLFKDGVLIGGVGVAGNDVALSDFEIAFKPSVNERIALGAQAGFRPNPLFAGSNVLIDGIRLAYQVGGGSNATVPDPATYLANPANGNAVVLSDIDGIPASPDDDAVDYSPKASPGPVTYPDPFGLVDRNGIAGELRTAIRADDATGGVIAISGGGGSSEARLSAAEVESILRLAVERSTITRAGIRLPRGQVARVWITVVGNPNSEGIEPPVLGTYRTPEATFFSWDVAVQKARTAIFFSRGLERGEPRAFSCRSVGFLSQEFYPPGILGTPKGPLQGLQGILSTKNFGGLLGGQVPLDVVNPNVPNGITIFPGGFPLYRNGVLVGAIGVSGDGIEQDDIIAASGARDFPPPPKARADNMVYERARIPYARFPRVASGF
jgi:uncharacterized protein GlcG (DUF336 family)